MAHRHRDHLNRRTVARLVATCALIGFGVVTLMAATRGNSDAKATSAATSKPLSLSEVPQVIPASGVWVDSGVMLLTPPGISTPAIGRDRAIEIGWTYDNARPFPATAVLARVTIPGTLPSPGLPEGAYNPITGTTNKYHPIEQRLVWVVTFTSPQPVDVSIGSPFTPVHPIDVTHDNLLLDAQTGTFVWGFFTK